MKKSELIKLVEEVITRKKLNESTYKEGYKAVEELEKASTRIFQDSADYGVPSKKDDQYWKKVQGLIKYYGIDGTKKIDTYGVGKTLQYDIELVDEWAVSDERKSIEEATDKYRIKFITCITGACKDKTGYFTINKLD